MELWPELKLGVLNGWIVLALLVLTDGLCFLVFPRDVVQRLFDRSGWSRKQVTFTVLGKVCALACLALLVATPLKIGTPVVVIGAVVSLLGCLGLAVALVNFRNTPSDQPVERGLYRISRHPQIVMSSFVLLGGAIAVGSWAALLALIAARVGGHFGILGEEEVCLGQYGEPYRAYLQRVPRYFLFF